MKAQEINVEIDELVLRGFRPEDRYAIGAAVERHLIALLETRGVPDAWLRTKVGGDLDAGRFAVGPRSTAAYTGARIAEVIVEERK
jgi:hypothetical protein